MSERLAIVIDKDQRIDGAMHDQKTDQKQSGERHQDFFSNGACDKFSEPGHSAKYFVSPYKNKSRFPNLYRGKNILSRVSNVQILVVLLFPGHLKIVIKNIFQNRCPIPGR